MSIILIPKLIFAKRNKQTRRKRKHILPVGSSFLLAVTVTLFADYFENYFETLKKIGLKGYLNAHHILM